MGQNNSITVEDTNLIDSLSFMKQKNFLKENKSKMIFDNVKEAEDSAKEEIYLSVKEALNNMKQDISFLQKRGYELKIEGIKLLEVPLKLKVWQSNASRKDLENIYKILESVVPTIDKLKKEQELKEQEAEKSESKK